MYLKKKNISIIGSGLVGSLLSIYLKKQGGNISVFDKRSDIRSSSINSGARSINLALSDRGIQALKKIGVSDSIMQIATPMYKRIMHSREGQLTDQVYSNKGQAIYSVSRHNLNAKLIEIAEKNRVKFFFKHKCIGVDINTTVAKFFNKSSVKSDFIFGADGAGSIVRKNMSKLFEDVSTSEKYIGYGYKELTIYSNSDGTHKLENHALHIWPRKSYMVIALPNLDGTFTCTLFAPLKGKNSFASLINKELVDAFFANNFHDLNILVSDISGQYFKNPLSSLGFVRSNSWNKKNTFLIGDACHATVPFYGQGMNAGFEDCYLLNTWINQHHGLHKNNINKFLNQRIIDTMAMQDLSISNFIEMRDKTADRDFLLQKKIEQWFSNKHPTKWIPLYSMVTFTHMGYNQAMHQGKLQDHIMKDIMSQNKLNSNFDIKELENKNIEQQILSRITSLSS